MTDEFEIKWRTYQALIGAFEHLSDVRFKLLGFVPAVSGFAIALISTNMTAFVEAPVPRVLTAVLGFVVTLGITFYDQRNSQLYNELFLHAANLEAELGIELGICNPRPGRTRKLFGVVTIWHDRGLAMIYGAVLGAWVFPVAAGGLLLMNTMSHSLSMGIAAIIAGVAAVVFIVEFHRLE